MTPAELDTVRRLVAALDTITTELGDERFDGLISAGRALLAAPQPHPVGWLESPYGAFRANPLHKIDAPQSVAWSLPVYLAAAPPQAAQETADERAAFEAWWERHGQFCRAGGGDYEKTFAFQAWQARAAQSGEPRRPMTGEDIRKIEMSLRKYTDNNRYDLSLLEFARAVERHHGIGGGDEQK